MFSKKKWSELSANEFNKKLKKVKLNNGRYSYGRQPEAALWALTQLGKSLDHFIDEKIIIEILNQFSKNFHISFQTHLNHYV